MARTATVQVASATGTCGNDPSGETANGTSTPVRSLRKRSTRQSDTAAGEKNTAAVVVVVVSTDPPTKKKRSVQGPVSKLTPVVPKENGDDQASSPDKNDTKPSQPSTKKKAPGHQSLTDRDELPKLWDPIKASANGSYVFRIASWNVAGLRAVLNKSPGTFRQLVDRYELDVLCLQETKLQEQHLTDPKLNIRETMGLDDFDDYWSCSTAKKGYSGTAVFVRRRGNDTKGTSSSSLLVPEAVRYTMGKEQHDVEGRIVMVEYPLFTLCNVYVPNAGQKLERLSYRTEQWDTDFLAFVQSKQSKRRPVLWLGDLNIAHTHLDVWNDGAKHLPKQAGVTPEERASFAAQLAAGDFVDAFRRLHPTAAGHYSYWSTRAGNRGPNKGLRLDYFICDPALWNEQAPVVCRDSYMAYEQEGSDHCPVILELEIKSNAHIS